MENNNLNNELNGFSESLEHIICEESNFAQKKTEGDNGLVISINAPWGAGKTFFLNYFIDKLKKKKYNISSPDPEKKEEKKVCEVIRYNAWEDDYIDPFLSLVSQFCQEVDGLNTKDNFNNIKEATKILWEFIPECAKHIPKAGPIIGIYNDLKIIYRKIYYLFKNKKFDNQLKEYNKLKKARKKFRDALSPLCQDSCRL